MEMNRCITVILCKYRKPAELIYWYKITLLRACVFHRTNAQGIRPVSHPGEVS